MKQQSDSAFPLSFSGGIKSVRDYNLNYTLIGFDLEEEFFQVFPRVGYLIGNLFIGESLECNFMNYSGEKFYRNRLYITGLFSEGSMLFSIKNAGKGYAFKIHPVVGHHLLKIPMTEAVDRRVTVSDALHIHGAMLRKLEENERIESIDNKLFQRFLWEALPDKRTFLDDPIYHAVNTIIAHKGNVRIRKLAAACHMSERTLRRQFLQKVGLSPQAYARIWKMQHAIDCIRNNPALSLEEVAWRVGYYDVAHLAHDFKNRVQIPPSLVNQSLSPLVQTYLDSSNMTG